MESRGKDRLDIEEERKEGCRKLWFDRAGNGRLVSLDYVVRCVFKDIQWSTITEYIHFMVPSFFQGLYLEWRIDPRWESSRDKKKRSRRRQYAVSRTTGNGNESNKLLHFSFCRPDRVKLSQLTGGCWLDNRPLPILTLPCGFNYNWEKWLSGYIG